VGDIQSALQLGMEIKYFVLRCRVLQVIQATVVGDSCHHGAKLQGSERDAFTKRAHLADATELFTELFRRKRAEVLAFYVVAREFAESKLLRVVADFFKS